MADAAASKDPINKLFFDEGPDSLVVRAEDALFGKKNSNVVSKRKRKRLRRYRQEEQKKSLPLVPPASPENLKDVIATKQVVPIDQNSILSEHMSKKRPQALKSLFSVSQEKEVT
jgi:hypothetical protein